MRSSSRELQRVAPAQLALFWLGIQAVWGALLGISLQARAHELAGASALGAYGTIATSGALVAAVVQIASGAASDAVRARVGRTPFYLAGALVAAVGIAWFYRAPALVPLIEAFIVVQLGMNVAMGAYQAIIPDFVTPAGRGIASAWMAALQGVGNAIGALAASFLGSTALAALLVALLLATCLMTILHVRRLGDAGSSPVKTPRASEEPAPVRALIDLFISRAFVYAGFYTLLGYLYFYVSSVLHSPHATTMTGLLLLLFTLLNPLGALVAAKPSDRSDKRYVAVAGGALFIAALLLFVGVPGSVAAIAATAIAGAGWGGFLVADWALGCRMIPPPAAATAMAVWNLAVVGPQIVAPAFTTLVLARAGQLSSPLAPRVALLLASCEVFTGIAWLMRLPRGLARE